MQEEDDTCLCRSPDCLQAVHKNKYKYKYNWNSVVYLQIVYKRYASLFFCFAVDRTDNELNVLEVIHRFFHPRLWYLGTWKYPKFWIFLLGMWKCWTNTLDLCVSSTSFSTLRKLTSSLMSSSLGGRCRWENTEYGLRITDYGLRNMEYEVWNKKYLLPTPGNFKEGCPLPNWASWQVSGGE